MVYYGAVFQYLWRYVGKVMRRRKALPMKIGKKSENCVLPFVQYTDLAMKYARQIHKNYGSKCINFLRRMVTA